MIKFLEGDGINAKIIECIKEADEYLILISPYIKLNEKVKAELKHLTRLKPDVVVEIIFGKNDDSPEKSLSKYDLEFIKQLPNINLSYSKELHAKIYCSEDRIIVGSMNLHAFSHANNFEAAFVIEGKKNWLGGLVQSSINQSAGKAWDDAMSFVNKVLADATPVYRKGPKYEPFLFGLMEKITGDDLQDNSGTFFQNAPQIKSGSYAPRTVTGFCIRTGKSIPFNLKRPFSEEAYKSWAKFKNDEFKEKYCHFSGEASHGETTFKNPILKKNWWKAKETRKF